MRLEAGETGGNALPAGGNAAPVAPAPTPTAGAAHAKPQAPPAPVPPAPAKAGGARDLQAMVDQLNKYLNDSGRPNQYRVDTSSGIQVIQEINPANGKVIGQFSAEQFPALARSLGVSGILINGRA